MVWLEDISVGASVAGIAGSAPVVLLQPNGMVPILWRSRQKCRQECSRTILYREDEERMKVAASSLPWSFDADTNLLRLVLEAYYINLTHSFAHTLQYIHLQLIRLASVTLKRLSLWQCSGWSQKTEFIYQTGFSFSIWGAAIRLRQPV